MIDFCGPHLQRFQSNLGQKQLCNGFNNLSLCKNSSLKVIHKTCLNCCFYMTPWLPFSSIRTHPSTLCLWANVLGDTPACFVSQLFILIGVRKGIVRGGSVRSQADPWWVGTKEDVSNPISLECYPASTDCDLFNGFGTKRNNLVGKYVPVFGTIYYKNNCTWISVMWSWFRSC